MMAYKIEFYAYLPKILIYFFLHSDLRSDPHPHFFSSWIRSRGKKMSDPHPWPKGVTPLFLPFKI